MIVVAQGQWTCCCSMDYIRALQIIIINSRRKLNITSFRGSGPDSCHQTSNNLTGVLHMLAHTVLSSSLYSGIHINSFHLEVWSNPSVSILSHNVHFPNTLVLSRHSCPIWQVFFTYKWMCTFAASTSQNVTSNTPRKKPKEWPPCLAMQHNSFSKTILQGTLMGGQYCGWQRKCWVDNIKEWFSLPHARIAHKGLLQKRLEEDLCWIISHAPTPRRPSWWHIGEGTELNWLFLHVHVCFTELLVSVFFLSIYLECDWRWMLRYAALFQQYKCTL